jgi:alpha-beta hydrolase superfamily lysophospholipase
MDTTEHDCTIERFTASDGYCIQYRRFPALGQSRARVVALHGIQSHGGWYTASAAYLARAGFTVEFLDRRGSGLNSVSRGDAPGFRRLLADIAEFLRAGEPAFLLAISWGGKLAVGLEQRCPGSTRGLILVAPGLRPRVRPPARVRLGILLARLFSPRRLFPIPLDDPTLFTANPARQAFIRDDPLSLRQATARFLVSSVHLDIVLRRAPKHIRVPVLLLLAGRDRIIDNDRTRAYLDRFASADRKVIEYAEAHHTLEFEPDPMPLFADIRDWLEQHVRAVEPQ